MTRDLDRQARRAATLKYLWFIHATVFVLVNLGLWLAGHRSGWLGLPTGGWVIGLLIHGLLAWLQPLGRSVYERLLQHERDRLQGR